MTWMASCGQLFPTEFFLRNKLTRPHHVYEKKRKRQIDVPKNLITDEINSLLLDKGAASAHLRRLGEVSETMQSLEWAMLRRARLQSAAESAAPCEPVPTLAP